MVGNDVVVGRELPRAQKQWSRRKLLGLEAEAIVRLFEDKSLNSRERQFPHSQNGDNNVCLIPAGY